MYDYVIVGAGLYGATFAREMTDIGERCLVLDRRKHIAGNCFSEKMHGIEVHKYGPHIFHTNSDAVWDYVRRFAKFNDYTHRVLANHNGECYTFPVNLNTMMRFYGLDEYEALRRFKRETSYFDMVTPTNAEEWLMCNVGPTLYEAFFYHYTKKQWGTVPKNLPIEVVNRIPIRETMDCNYHNHKYSGIPIDGYTSMVWNMLSDVPTKLEVDYQKERDYWDSIAKCVVFTGPIDEFFDFDLGHLDYRSLRFETSLLPFPWYQATAQINFTQQERHTRIVEHKHFHNEDPIDCTIITKEFPVKYQLGRERYYPINDKKNQGLYEQYRQKIDGQKYIFGGRLATYKYLDMDQVIGSALARTKRIKEKK